LAHARAPFPARRHLSLPERHGRNETAPLPILSAVKTAERLRVFYTPQQTVLDNESFSPSAGKPAQVVESWKKLGLPIDIVAPEPVTPEQIALAHDPSYVQGVLSGTMANGFGNTKRSVADSLVWTVGSMVSAAIDAISTGSFAASPTSGFHHAGYAHGGGFCTFNGLIVAARILREKGLAKKVGILDLDRHYGNGSDEIIKKLGLDFIQHYTFGQNGITPANAEKWLEELPEIVRSFKGCDVLLFQAGADPHIDDPLGHVLTTEQMARRDQIVFEACSELGLPVAWNLAGGYQKPIEKVLELHDNTARAAVAALPARHGRKAKV
jgi:acetoin utilization deacetylase AcuC-like enzyme